MATDSSRILVIGAGVNGSICAVGLHNAGFDVTVLARGERFEEIKSKGIIIEDQFRHTRSVTHLPVIDVLKPTDYYDYILVVVRKNQVYDLLPILAKNVSPNIVFMINNPSGPEEYTKILGKERVMLGFGFAGGRREGDTIRAMIPKSRWFTTPFGEIDGSITPRLKRLITILQQAGFHVEISRNISDWQSTHAALVPCLAMPLMRYNLDVKALAKSDADLGLIVDAMRETLDVLEALNIRITPRSTHVIRYIPRFLLIIFLRMLLPSKFMEVGGVWHASQASDEMNQLAKELGILVERSGLPVPELKKLLSNVNLHPRKLKNG
jgi:2-dehydropantoate 2-reductase